MSFDLTRRAALGGLGAAALAPHARAQASQADSAFAELAANWVEDWLALHPVEATQLGDHRFDRRVNDLGGAGRGDRIALAERTLRGLDRIHRAALTHANLVDAAILANEARALKWTIETLRPHLWDPLIYQAQAGDAIYTLMARDFAPAADRLRTATRRMDAVRRRTLPEARRQLDKERVPRVHAETYARQNPGLKSIVDELIAPQAAALSGSDRRALERAMRRFREAVDEHQRWIETELLPRAHGDDRLGAERFDQKLRFTLNANATRQEIRLRAEAAVRRVRAEMGEIARHVLGAGAPADEQSRIAAALERAAADRPAPDELVATSEAAVAEATAFVRARDLITLPPDPVRVILMPAFQRGVSVAYCDSPGPFEEGQNTYYAVSPIPEDWTSEQATSFLREYNRRMILDIAVHEAMPGHYVQIGHSRAEESKLRAMHYSGSFVEGWACYAEEMMARNGFRAGDPLYRLAQLKVQLRTITNAILDQMVHVDNVGEAEAMRFMMETAFQEEREAAGKWVRARVSSTQLSTYFVGLEEHLAARAAAEAKWGAGFDQKRYHDGILSFGSPPVRYARALLLDEPIL